MKTAHFAAFVAMQNARRLSGSGAVLGTTDVIILGGILLVTLIVVVWLISKM